MPEPTSKQRGLLMAPTVGRVVHYVSYGTPNGEFTPAHRAAIVTQAHTPTCVDLCVMNPTGLFFSTSVQMDCPDDSSPANPREDDSYGYPGGYSYRGGSWHWPERDE